MRNTALILALFALPWLTGCMPAGQASNTPAQPTPAKLAVRAARRAYTGAPPVIPHAAMSTACISCHTPKGEIVPNYGIAPANPHTKTAGLSANSRCVQCHVFQNDKSEFAKTEFVGLAVDGRKGSRLYPGSPPTVPHPAFMRENCAACHSGVAARPEIRCSHATRIRCQQCHVDGYVPPDEKATPPIGLATAAE